MAVDIKTLRIGSHINLCGKRQRIMAIDALNWLIGIDAYKTDENGVKHPFGYKVEDIEPISIMPDLLKELGFEDCEKKRWHTEDWEKRWGECQYLSFTKLYRGEWRVHYFDGAKDRGQTVVRYLHEAEAFLALHNVELIKE